jgi:hypothetical protein
VLSVIGFNFAAIFIVGGTIQRLVHHHLDIGILTGSATGSSLASLIMIWAWRAGQVPTR